MASTTMTYSNTPITSTSNGQVIENLDLTVTGSGPAIRITSSNVTVRNVHIHAQGGGDGIDISNASNTVVSSVEIDGPAPNGNGGGDGSNGISSDSAFKADHVTLKNMGTGIYLVDAPGASLSNIVGYDMQGPFPGGQLVQFSRSGNATLNNFYLHNNASTSHPEDDISVFNSPNVTISNGVIDGDNAPSGVGVMFEGNSQGGVAHDIDAIHMGNGAFSSYSDDVTFDHVRSFDTIPTDQGRGAPLSGGTIFNDTGNNVVIKNSTYTNPAPRPAIVWPGNGSVSVSEDKNATPMAHITNGFPWETTTQSPQSVNASPAPAAAASSSASVKSTTDGTNHTLVGTGGNDVLADGPSRGYYDISGKGGADTFAWHLGSGVTEIEDFSGAQKDVIQVDKSLFSSFSDLLTSASNAGTNDMAISSSKGDQLILDGVRVEQLTASNFAFV